jgi:hypothetical protein
MFRFPLAVVAAALALAAGLPAAASANQKCWSRSFSCAGHPGGTMEAALALPGGLGVLAGFHPGTPSGDLCATVAHHHDPYSPLHYGGDNRYYAIWVHAGGDRPRSAWLACAPATEVWGLTAGPGDGVGDSIRCPHESRPVSHGAAWTVSAARGYGQTYGGFGDNHDGYWDYRFYNPLAGAVTARLYGICVIDRGAVIE